MTSMSTRLLKTCRRKIRDVVLFGSGDEIIEFQYFGDNGVQKRRHPFAGIIPNLERRYRETDSRIVREELSKYISRNPARSARASD